MFNFLERGQSSNPIVKLFKGFCAFLPRTLLGGFIYVKRYSANFKYKFQKIENLIKIYLACCIISKKYELDSQTWSSEAARGWGLDVAEVNYLEALVLNGLDYNLHVSNSELQRASNSISADYESNNPHLNYRLYGLSGVRDILADAYRNNCFGNYRQ